MRKGIIHIGLPKTGTTSFQNAIYQNRERIYKEQEIYYPAFDANHTNALCAMFLDDPRSHITLKLQNITSLDDAEQIRRSYKEKIELELNQTDYKVLVFSAEGLANLHAQPLSRLREWLSNFANDWEAIFWTRHPVSFAISDLQQRLRGGATIAEFEDVLPLPNFRGRLRNAFSAFGPSNVKVFSFEAALGAPGSIVAEFCRQIGVGGDLAMEIARTSRRENETISMVAAHVLDSLNVQRPMFINGKMNPRRRPHDVGIIMRILGPKFDVPAAMKQKFKIASREDVQWLNDTLGTNYYSDVFSDLAPEEPLELPLERTTIDSLALMISDLVNARF